MKVSASKGLLIVAALLLVVGIAGLSSCSKKPEVIVMGTNAAFPPFESKGGTDGSTIIGFDVEIAKEIAKDLGKELKIEDMEFDSLLPALGSGKIDMALAGMTITEERKNSVDFSEPYYAATQALLINKATTTITSLDLLKGKKIAVQLGTTGDGMAKKYTDAANVVQFPTVFEAVMELVNKKVDAVIIDEQPAKVMLTKNADIQRVTVDFPAEFYGISMKKGNAALLESVNKTLARLKQEGKYDALVAEWIK